MFLQFEYKNMKWGENDTETSTRSFPDSMKIKQIRYPPVCTPTKCKSLCVQRENRTDNVGTHKEIPLISFSWDEKEKDSDEEEEEEDDQRYAERSLSWYI